MFIFCVTVLLVTGCTEKTNEIIESPTAIEKPGNNELIEEEISKSLVADPAKFHFVADWLTESKVIYVEKENGHYQVNSFDFESGQTDTLYEDDSMIIDVLIHPSKKYLLLHTSDNAASATVKIVTMDGTVHDEVIVASTELAIEWNDTDPMPHFLATTGNKLNLAGTAWFAIVMALLTWTMPGVNALLVRVRRPDLVRNAPFGKALPWLGLVWLVFPVWIYIFAVFKPIENSLEGGGKLHYLETNGILDALLFYAIGVVIYVVMQLRSRSAGVDTKMLFTEIPPD